MNVARKLTHCRTVRSITTHPNDGSTPVLPFEAIPGPRPMPLVGNMWRYLPLIGDYDIDQLYKNASFNRQKYGPIVREEITRRHVVLHLFDHQDVETFFRQDGSEPCRRSHRALLKFRHDNPERYNDGGIFPENGPSWSRLRGLFHKYLMKRTPLTMRIGILDDVAKQTIRDLSSRIRSHPLVIEDFASLLQTWTIKSALAVFLDYDHATMPKDQILNRLLKSLDDLLAAIAGTEIRSERWASQPAKCPYYQTLSRTEEFTYAFVSERIEHLLSSSSFREVSFVRDWLVGDQIDLKDVITFILDCLLASVHTTTYTTTFLLENISRQLSGGIRDELLEETRTRLPSMIKTIGEETLDEMPLLRDCLKETLRLHPVSIGTGRLTQHDMTIRNYHVPRGVMVIAHNQLICRDETLYSNPERYLPTRWSSYRSQSRSERPSRFAWLPYGFGPRACLGQRLVNLQIQILAARFLQNFDIEFLGEIDTRTQLVHCLDGRVGVRLRNRPRHPYRTN